ncbi:MAG TPA: MFS transporter [Dehalococcoidia bacterium]|nr:MFS transporter [Dehalococcoidia bacterium]
MSMTPGRRPRFFYGYVVAAACFAIQGIGIGTFISFGVFFKPLLNEFGWSRAAISGASSVSFLVAGLLGIFVGSLNDKFGPKLIMTITGFFFGLGYLLMSQLEALWQLYLFYGVVIGLGMSSIDVIMLSTVARWFVRRRGVMTGMVKVGTGAGQLVIPLLASVFIAAYGWRNAYIIIGAMVLVLIISIGRLLRRDPGEMGLLPDGDGETVVVGENDLTGGGLSLDEARRTREFWTLCVVNLAVVYCLLTVMVHIVPHARDIGISAIKAAGILSTIGGVSMVGRLVTGIAIDRMGSKRAMMGSLLILIISFSWLLMAKELWMLYLFAVVYGLAHGGIFTVISPIVAEHFGISSHGVIFGIVVFSGTIGGAIGPLLAGHIFDLTGSYQLVFLILAALGTVSLVLTSLLRPVRGEIG